MVEKQTSISTYIASTDFIKDVGNLWILEAATDRRFVKIDFLKSTIKFLEKYLWKSCFSKAAGSNPKILRKMNSFTNIFQELKSTDLS